MARFRDKDRPKLKPMDIGYYIANALLGEGAEIDEIYDLPLTTTIRFTMKKNVFKDKVMPLVAWNLSGEIDDKMAQVVDSELLIGEIWQYKVMFIKAFFLGNAREELAG